MKIQSLFTGLAATALASSAAAHSGPRIWIDQSNGQAVTLASDNDHNPTSYTPSRLFDAHLDVSNITSFPGFEAPRGLNHHLNAGDTFGFNITGPALYYDDASNTFKTVEEMFADLDNTPQLGMALYPNTWATSTGPVTGSNAFFTFTTTTGGASGGTHVHFDFALLGDASTPSAGPEGVYALALELTSNNYTTSETFYILFGTPGETYAPGSEYFEEARLAAQATLVPEPTAMSILMVGGIALLGRRRR